MKKIAAPIRMKKQPDKSARNGGRSGPKAWLDTINDGDLFAMGALTGELVSLVTSEVFVRVVNSVKARKFSDGQFRIIARAYVDALSTARANGKPDAGYDFSDDDLDCSVRLGLALLQAHYSAFGDQP